MAVTISQDGGIEFVVSPKPGIMSMSVFLTRRLTTVVSFSFSTALSSLGIEGREGESSLALSLVIIF